MTRVVFYTASTLNGFLADEHDSLEWLFAVPGGDSAEGGDEDFAGFIDRIGVMVEGSSTYEWVLDHERLLERPERWQESYGALPTFVFTSLTLPVPAGADVRFVSGSVTDAWDEIRAAAAGRDVWVVGGGDLVGQFDDAGLLDELIITYAPAVLTPGKPLLPRTLGPDRLHLESVSRTGQFAQLRYTVRPR